jgi:cobalt-zinc-cadmium efflux system outer membrane protein
VHARCAAARKIVMKHTTSAFLCATALMLLGGEPCASESEPGSALRIETAVARAVSNDPVLVGYARAAAAADALVVQSKARPNPALTVEVEDFAGSGAYGGFDEAQSTISLSQTVELGGKRNRRIEEASAAVDVAESEYFARLTERTAEARLAFIAVVAHQDAVTLTTKAEEWAQDLVADAKRRRTAGSASGAEVAKAEIALSDARMARARAERALTTARRRLTARWGKEVPDFERAEGALGELVAVPSAERLDTRLGANPEVARWNAEVRRRDARAARETSEAIPDVTVGVGYRRLSGPDEDAVVAGISIPLPVFDRRRGARDSAEMEAEQARQLLRAAELERRVEIDATLAFREGAREELETMTRDVLPQASATFESVRRGYREGRFPYLDVLDARRTLLDAELRVVAVKRDIDDAAVEIGRLIGDVAAEAPSARPVTRGVTR